MASKHFQCTRCGRCCRASIPLGLAEALDHDESFLLALVFSMETWNLDDFAANRPVLPITHEDLFTTLAFRKDKLAMDASRDLVFRVGRAPSGTQRLATFVTVGAAALGDFHAGQARCPSLAPDDTCSIYDRRPLGCRVFPLDPLFPEMLQHVPLAGLETRLPCDFSPQAPEIWREGSLTDPEALALLARRQETIRRDSLFLPYYRVAAEAFRPMPTLPEILKSLGGNGRLDLPFAPALVYLTAAGAISPERAERCLERQTALARKAVEQALARKDKAERARTAVLRNCLSLMESFTGRIAQAADTAPKG
ncbi:hypothetical protein NNJEOMEG_01484 [Fundidesulfovibrio magnetotacticus]|uniref:Fe-S oxidoreductase n=1 Tax=Fundidesulfovibrio magnetotacticus TaxID=2730080 RepID=A0A6V8LRP8_9BACT|nr:hypothetical protein [Fundidesulfovibrio magnetotacticus]GFK93650.1 hypothetical protein NNJEOMEG_01484 [Fundidesulfovibrio magnetotacticus]